ncbi:hypothetical protein DFJ77DRAFT_439854 [Powellomyces hirtus]|nr:hypothetical protein DFJ77DRAFT_439854 [Powellomyces hirtus]
MSRFARIPTLLSRTTPVLQRTVVTEAGVPVAPVLPVPNTTTASSTTASASTATPITTAGALPPAKPTVVVTPLQSTAGFETAKTTAAPPTPPPRKAGFFRGGLIGFLTGLTLAGTTAYVYLLDDYSASSAQLLTSVENLEKSTTAIAAHARKIDVLEKQLKEFMSRSPTKRDLENQRSELLKAIDSAATEHLELRTRVWELEQDLKAAQAK